MRKLPHSRRFKAEYVNRPKLADASVCVHMSGSAVVRHRASRFAIQGLTTKFPPFESYRTVLPPLPMQFLSPPS